MKNRDIKWRCTNTAHCGRVWNSEFSCCQRCGSPLEMVTQENEVIADPARPVTVTYAKPTGAP